MAAGTSRTGRITASARGAAARLRPLLWPIAQQTLAASSAWFLAGALADEHNPFFAPIAAVVALNTDVGARGIQALRLLLGVLIGIGVGDVVLLSLGGGMVPLALAVLVSMCVAALFGGARVTLAQAAASAILVVTVPLDGTGLDRAGDALIGVGVALVLTQVLFPPHPLRLVRRAESAVLRQLGRGLRLTAEALRGDDADADGRAVDALLAVRKRLGDVDFVLRAGPRVARHSLAWRRHRVLLVAETETAAQLEFLGPDGVAVGRAALSTTGDDRAVLVPTLRALGDVLADFAVDPGSQQRRRRLSEEALRLREAVAAMDRGPAGHRLLRALTAIDVLLADLLVFAGATDPDGS